MRRCTTLSLRRCTTLSLLIFLLPSTFGGGQENDPETRALIITPPCTRPAVDSNNKIEVISFLSKCGCFTGGNRYDFDMNDDTYRAGIKHFQVKYGVKPNRFGYVDEETERVMNKFGSQTLYSCYDSDIILQDWKSGLSNITYRITKYPSTSTTTMANVDVDREVRKAFDLWSGNAALHFIYKRRGPVHMDLRFENGSCGYDSEWSQSAQSSPKALINLYTSAAHAIGHNLGLSHSRARNSIMGAYYKGYVPNLAPDDIQEIQKLYGPDLLQVPKNNGEPERCVAHDCDLCDNVKMDTIVNHQGSIYVFSGNFYWKLVDNSTLLEEGYPRNIVEDWDGLPGNIDASFTWKNGKTFFFKGTKVWRFTVGKMDGGYPRNIRKSLPGIPNDLDAAFYSLQTDIVYFFKGTEYWEYNKKISRTPKPISDIPGFPGCIDAAFRFFDDRIYAFVERWYYRIYEARFALDNNHVESFPKLISDKWFKHCKKEEELRKKFGHGSASLRKLDQFGPKRKKTTPDISTTTSTTTTTEATIRDISITSQRCSPPDDVAHSISIFLSPDVVKYTCKQDYVMVGQPILVCVKGSWITSPPSCQPKLTTVCDSKPCHQTALCSPIPSGFQCQCQVGEVGDPYHAGCLSNTRFEEVMEAMFPMSELLCGYNRNSATSKHVQCGTSVSASDAPWQVSIVDKIRRMHWCGAVLISEKYALTAAHCFETTECNLVSRRGNNKCEPSEFLVLLGRTNATFIYSDGQLLDDINSVERTIEEVYVHPKWQHENQVSNGNDIAVLKIKRVRFSINIRPACLPNPSKHFSLHKNNQQLEITGFGRNDSLTSQPQRSIPHKLQLIDMRIINKMLCDNKLDGDVAPDIFCAVPSDDKDINCLGKSASCKGDSGGPGVVKDLYGQYVVVGLVAGGPPCGENDLIHPHYMTSTSHHLEFILQHMEELPCPPPLGAPTPPTCKKQYVQFVSDLECLDISDCPEGARCFENACTLYRNDEQARLAKTNCSSAQQCNNGAFRCDISIEKCSPNMANNGTVVHMAGGIRVLNVPSLSSQGVLHMSQDRDSQRSNCYNRSYGIKPCAVRTTDDRVVCKRAHCNRYRKCWCPYPVGKLLNLSSGTFG